MNHSLFSLVAGLMLSYFPEALGAPTITVINGTGGHAQAGAFQSFQHFDSDRELGAHARTLFASYEDTFAIAIQNTDIELSPSGLFASGSLSLDYLTREGAQAGGNDYFDLWFTVTDAEGAKLPFTFQATTSDAGQDGDAVSFASGDQSINIAFGHGVASSGTVSGELGEGTYRLRANVGYRAQAVSFRLIVGTALPVEPKLKADPLGSGAFHLSFQTASTVSYQLQRSDDLTNWTDVGSPIVGDGAVNSVNDTNVHLAGYWRMRLQL